MTESPVGMFSGTKGVTFEVHAPTDEEPTTVALEVTVEGDLVLSESVMPDYEETFPNGPDCGVCRSASVEFVLPERSVDSDPGDWAADTAVTCQARRGDRFGPVASRGAQ